ncbi:MAG: M28 family peptidase [Deltaproteobacteria bacterium]|nr:M28 family peptidase [Deltaproteobacteria bacterium]
MDFDREQMRRWILQQIGLGPRRAGSPAGRTNEDLLMATLGSLGLERVRREPIPVVHSKAERWGLEVGANDEKLSLKGFPIPFTAFTPDTGVSGRLVFADRHKLFQRGDWRGAIVVAEIGFPELDVAMLLKIASGVHDPDDSLAEVKHPATWVRLGWHLYHLAARKGAAGFVGVLVDQPGGSAEMYAPYGFREADILDKPLPGLWIGRAEGAALIEAARAGAAAKLTLTGKREEALTHNLVAEVPGQSGETIVLSCHHDAPFVSPVEDASGVAVVLALAGHFAKSRDLKRRLVILLSAGHFYGSIGTRTFIEKHREDLLPDVVLEISIEHIAREAIENKRGTLVDSGKPEATGVFVPFNRAVTDAVMQAMASRELSRVVALPAEGPLGDYPPTDGGDWWEAGVPVINCISNPVYLLTNDDNIRWVDEERLTRMAAAFADILRKVDAMPREEIAKVDSKTRRLFMKALKVFSRAKTTAFGLKPVY